MLQKLASFSNGTFCAMAFSLPIIASIGPVTLSIVLPLYLSISFGTYWYFINLQPQTLQLYFRSNLNRVVVISSNVDALKSLRLSANQTPFQYRWHETSVENCRLKNDRLVIQHMSYRLSEDGLKRMKELMTSGQVEAKVMGNEEVVLTKEKKMRKFGMNFFFLERKLMGFDEVYFSFRELAESLKQEQVIYMSEQIDVPKM